VNKQVVRRAIALIHQCPAPDQSTTFWNADNSEIDEITGYRWRWNIRHGYIAISIRFAPEQRCVGQDGVVTLTVSPHNVAISGSDAGTNLDGDESHQISFVARKEQDAPIVLAGLTELLRSALKVPSSI
jgi:hypothetical protein